MDKYYGGVIWTKHALERLTQRNISQSKAFETLKHPNQSRYAKTKQAWIYYRTYGDQKIEVVAKKKDNGEWIIISVWSRPVYSQYDNSFLTKVVGWLVKKIFKTSGSSKK